MSSSPSSKGFSLKDQLFNEKKTAYLAGLFSQSDPGFDAKSFETRVMASLLKLELKQRIAWISTCLDGYLSANFATAAAQIQAALPPPLDATKTDNDFGDFIFAPLGDYVVRHGCNQTDLQTSLALIKELTQRFSMEDSIRAFINGFADPTFATLTRWSEDENYHVRRLVSEGSRPLLPWSGRLKTDPMRALPLLDNLYADKTRYVTRSVANHLNDIAKIEPNQVIARLRQWQDEGRQQAKEMDWMTRHSLRTLVKKGNHSALALLGFEKHPAISINDLQLTPEKLTAGGKLLISFQIKAQKDCHLMVDYIVDFMKASGGAKPKVFKLKQFHLREGDSINLRKTHRFLSDATTYKLYPGRHRITLQINGQPYCGQDFEII